MYACMHVDVLTSKRVHRNFLSNTYPSKVPIILFSINCFNDKKATDSSL